MGIPAFGPPAPIDPSYTPEVSIASVPADAPIDEILDILERDGGVILTNFATVEDLAAIDTDLEAYRTQTPSTEKGALHIIPKETLAISGLVAKSPTVAKICESPVLEQLRASILQDDFSVIREDHIEKNTIDPLLSISMTFHIGYGAPRQRLHRDDNVHGVRHGGEFDLKKVSQFACLIAATKTTRENGATMFIPGSHKWDDTRRPRTDEVCFAASCYHGGGHNSVPGEVRKVHGLFFVRGTMRTEENQFLAVPRSKVLTMSDKMLSLLGYKKPTTVLGIVENEDPAQDLRGVLERAAR
ncbi:hypothetical protein A1O1_04113 [Capronia coronata CBS 617.96]|uniref:Uncharacterized protein n=1 Tax=Capronia coronata CBS 617.96 TaxID=1182541 RepID=W9YP50_9EURO|nr:uncharacterized protein A1O1_04113 [Capronia coronata CBS 617.96]EXJ91006.1 hypothetical protein A1O1_04113 [Capronia coronata CBS 617.96]